MELIIDKYIDLKRVLLDAKPKGIIECGAYTGTSVAIFDLLDIANRCLIEASPSTFIELTNNVDTIKNTCLNYAVTDTDKEVEFMVTNDPQCNSYRRMSGLMRKIFPTIRDKETIKVQGRSLDSLIDSCEINIKDYDFLLMDVQGCEYDILKGFEKNIHNINYIQAEISYGELYDGSMLVDEFDEYLKRWGFEKILATQHVVANWGDAYYKRTL